MEQYWMPKNIDFKNLRMCIDNYKADWLFIRLKGSSGGDVKVNEDLDGKTIDFKRDRSGLHLLLNSDEIFNFPLEDYNSKYTKGFSLAYERFRKVNGKDVMVFLGTGEDPYDKNLPEPRRSLLRHVLDNHLVEIFFKGRVNLKFHSWWEKPYWKYWEISK